MGLGESAYLRTGLVCGVFGQSTILRHFTEVKRTVQSTRKLGNINIKCELLVHELEHLVFGLTTCRHQVCSGTNVGVIALGDKVELQRVTRCGNTVCSGVVSTLQHAVGSASFSIRADSFVPRVSGVAVGVSGLVVKPSPVGVNDDGLSRSLTSACGTLTNGKSRMCFGFLGTGQLGAGRDQQSSEGEGGSKHDERFAMQSLWDEDLRRELLRTYMARPCSTLSWIKQLLSVSNCHWTMEYGIAGRQPAASKQPE
jgi:hypothetical protein